MLTGRFLDDYVEMIDRWAAWATDIVRTWPPEPRKATPDMAAMAVTARQAAARVERWTAASGADGDAAGAER